MQQNPPKKERKQTNKSFDDAMIGQIDAFQAKRVEAKPLEAYELGKTNLNDLLFERKSYDSISSNIQESRV